MRSGKMTDQAVINTAIPLLHRADPRLKLLVCGALVILVFATALASRVAVIAAGTIMLCLLARCGPRWLAQTLWPWRWLLCFTLLLHLLLSPGHTLFGVGWLSRDGLLRGLLVCAQVGVAALAAALLNVTTPAGETARACGWLLSPLARFGLPVRHWEEMVALVLRFFPVMREELRETATAGVGSWYQRVVSWEERLLPLFDRLVSRADHLASRIVAGEEEILPAEKMAHIKLLASVNLPLTLGLPVIWVIYFVSGLP